ncbi:hypothetical protein D3C79_140600 [compost metagenome]
MNDSDYQDVSLCLSWGRFSHTYGPDSGVVTLMGKLGDGARERITVSPGMGWISRVSKNEFIIAEIRKASQYFGTGYFVFQNENGIVEGNYDARTFKKVNLYHELSVIYQTGDSGEERLIRWARCEQGADNNSLNIGPFRGAAWEAGLKKNEKIALYTYSDLTEPVYYRLTDGNIIKGSESLFPFRKE